MNAIVLTISDSSHRGERPDVSGPRVKERLESAGYHVPLLQVLPDDRPLIAWRLRELATSGECDAIFTTGGTGVSARDNTPEATREVIEREIPGFGELMRAEGLKKTPLAPLSRATAGTLARVLIVNLPGSPKGAVESLDAILGLVPHVHKLLCGETGH
ncbi:MAG: MogA/MoaB family molybdenum cofactor biosynthesis protein [Acidobacteriota bacterium]